ncbi:MAG TPA: hypothetical protein VF695_09905 [Sphingomonas sp.]|jgi:hypothetical protein
MRTIHVIAAAALASLTATIGVAREPEQRFTHDGATYTYTTTSLSGDRQVIEGRRLDDGRRFRLVVRGDRVSGITGGTPVSFKLADARGAASTVDLAAN